MNTTIQRRLRAQTILPVGILVILSCAAWALQKNLKITMDDRVLSTDVQIIKGRAYIPVLDVAKALDRTLVKNGANYRLMRTKGTDQADGLPGKMAVNLFSGPWRLNVVSIKQVAGYSPLYGAEKEMIMPKEAGDVLVAIQCQLNNGTREMQEVAFDKNGSGDTALLDDQEHGYVPVGYDTRISDYTSSRMPPGTTQDFVVLFSIPKGVNLTEFTYTVRGTSMDKNTNFRVSLKP